MVLALLGRVIAPGKDAPGRQIRETDEAGQGRRHVETDTAGIADVRTRLEGRPGPDVGAPAPRGHRQVAGMIAPEVLAMRAAVPRQFAGADQARVRLSVGDHDPVHVHEVLMTAGRADHLVAHELVHLSGDACPDGRAFVPLGLAGPDDLREVAVGARAALEILQRGGVPAAAVEVLFVHEQILHGDGRALAGRFGRGQLDAGAVLEQDVLAPVLGYHAPQHGAALEHGPQFLLHHAVAGLAGGHGQHLDARTVVHGPSQAGIERLAYLQGTADHHLAHAWT